MGQISEVNILMKLHVLRSFESENHIFSNWSLFLLVFSNVSSITKENLQKADILHNLHLYQMYIFRGSEKYAAYNRFTKIRKYYWLRMELLVGAHQCIQTVLHMMQRTHTFDKTKNSYLTETGMSSIYTMPTEPHKNFS